MAQRGNLRPVKNTTLLQNRKRFLAYSLPRDELDRDSRTNVYDDYLVYDEPLGAEVSFLDYDGVVMFAGSYEKLISPGTYNERVSCRALTDLDRREREFHTGHARGQIYIFLLARVVELSGGHAIPWEIDLFRRVARGCGIDWDQKTPAIPSVTTQIAEFKDYIGRHGTGYLKLKFHSDNNWLKPLCLSGKEVFGLIGGDRLYFLPSPAPQSRDQNLEIVSSAITAVMAYRERTSTELPEWAGEFRFDRESILRNDVDILQRRLNELNHSVDGYHSYKGALCYRSDPLVKVVTAVFDRFFGLKLTTDDKCIEDAGLLSAAGEYQAVIEIKGINSSFGRTHINQVDSHRERLNLPATTPGILIMNTMMSATDLSGKEEEPHPDIIKHAVNTNVLIIRTLDLLRYADLVESGTLSQESFCNLLLTESGWLKVKDGKAEIVKEATSSSAPKKGSAKR